MSKYTPDCKNRWYKQLNKRKGPESGKDPDVMVISDDSNAAESSDSEAMSNRRCAVEFTYDLILWLADTGR